MLREDFDKITDDYLEQTLFSSIEKANTSAILGASTNEKLETFWQRWCNIHKNFLQSTLINIYKNDLTSVDDFNKNCTQMMYKRDKLYQLFFQLSITKEQKEYLYNFIAEKLSQHDAIINKHLTKISQFLKQEFSHSQQVTKAIKAYNIGEHGLGG